MYVVLLTGGLASGKDTVSTMLAGLGAMVLDLDSIAKEEQEKPFVLTQLQSEFGQDIVDESGLLVRKLLAMRAFSNAETATKLNEICWPPVKEYLRRYLDNNSEVKGLLIVQVPLLVEAPDFLEFKDEVIAVLADEELRLKRALARGMSTEDARNRIALQAEDNERIALSDTVFINNSTHEALREQVIFWHNTRIESGSF